MDELHFFISRRTLKEGRSITTMNLMGNRQEYQGKSDFTVATYPVKLS